jgi:desulfoferrodoxin (superoxide reductase-like protein)
MTVFGYATLIVLILCRMLRLLGCFAILFLVRCGQPSTASAETERLRNQVYFTKADPGRWKDFAKDHEPEIKKVSPGQIEVNVPVSPEMGHYIEVILISDAMQRELAVKHFKRGEKPHAVLSIPPEKMPNSQVIAKCNLHGMWRKALP